MYLNNITIYRYITNKGETKMWARRFGMHHVGPFFNRGAVKFMILDMLKERPKHGYEIMKDIEEKVGGFYAASPGSVYPTLQMLEDQGYLTSEQSDGKKVYQITDEGRKYLDENKEVLENVQEKLHHTFPARFSREQREIMRDLHDLVRSMAQEVRRGSNQPEKWKKIREVLAHARQEVDDILSN
jgi:DNA-binding PadR family transcriptional regulator